MGVPSAVSWFSECQVGGTAILIRFRTAWQPGPWDEHASLPALQVTHMGRGLVMEVPDPHAPGDG